MRILSFDISSSCIGWALFKLDEEEATLIDYGNIKPPKKEKGSLSFRLKKTEDEVLKIIGKYNPDEVAIEDYAKRFSMGRSTANTIIMLSVFNEVTTLLCYKNLGKDPFRYPVITIRSCIGKFYGEKIVSKDDIFPAITSRSKIFLTRQSNRGNLLSECLDEGDAIAVGMTHLIKTKSVKIINT